MQSLKHRITVSIYKGAELRDKFSIDYVGKDTDAAKIGDEYATGMKRNHDLDCEAKVHIQTTSLEDAA